MSEKTTLTITHRSSGMGESYPTTELALSYEDKEYSFPGVTELRIFLHSHGLTREAIEIVWNDFTQGHHESKRSWWIVESKEIFMPWHPHVRALAQRLAQLDWMQYQQRDPAMAELIRLVAVGNTPVQSVADLEKIAQTTKSKDYGAAAALIGLAVWDPTWQRRENMLSSVSFLCQNIGASRYEFERWERELKAGLEQEPTGACI
jgi:hypothetical protein